MSINTSKFTSTLILAFFPLSLAINLVNFFWMDTVFILSTIGALFWAKRSHSDLKEVFGLKSKTLLVLLLIYFFSGITGYVLHSPMQTNEWVKISNLRWIWGLFACYSIGHILAAQGKKMLDHRHFIALLTVLLAIVFNHLNVTSGAFFSPAVRLQGFYSNPAFFAMAAVVLWASLIPYLIYNHSKASGLGATALLTCLTVILIATYTRSSWIAMVAVLIFTLFYTKNKKAILVAGLTLAAATTAVLFNLFQMKDRILQTLDFSGVSQGARIEIWNATWHIFLDHPVFGVGFEYAVKLYKDYYIKLGQSTVYIPGHAHNQFLDVLSGSGIVGLIGYLGVFGAGFVFFHKKFKSATDILSKQLSLGSLLCIVALFGCSFTETPIIQQETRNYVLIVLGFSYGYLSRGAGTSQTTDPRKSHL
ncbi:O-antigen ligase family protein [Bdellovibrio bacteriovorus]|uniref:O-antigen ligase n=1 Tax=Bdellovibrio bacteriovorus TaxID=959 RepID=A0A1Z3N919_BDEBC|nr:O-antigen ligase family protein [Bdellovibrio bacteriovorus]ASD63973.1 O-antigen ligase [Bdellovibrio bacteriovorus]